MNTASRTLAQIAAGDEVKVSSLCADGAIRRRLLDLGLIPGTRVHCVQASPAGDPVAYLIRGAVIALRREDSATIQIV